MSHIAVDIVLIPDEPLFGKAINISKNLNSDIRLGEHETLPHISLAMGCVEESKLVQLNAIIEATSRVFNSFALTIPEYVGKDLEDERILVSYGIENSPLLQALHEQMFQELSRISDNSKISADSFAGGAKYPQYSSNWVKNYQNSAMENFWPHITLGFGEPEAELFPIDGGASTLAAYQLGDYCTCQSLLFKSKLEPV